MTALATVRQQIVDAVTPALAGVPVFPYWPPNVAAPCAVVALGAGRQDMAHRWVTNWTVTLVGTSADNTAAQQWVETTVVAAAAALSAAFNAPASWDPPGRINYAGQDYYVGILTLPLDLEA